VFQNGDIHVSNCTEEIVNSPAVAMNLMKKGEGWLIIDSIRPEFPLPQKKHYGKERLKATIKTRCHFSEAVLSLRQ